MATTFLLLHGYGGTHPEHWQGYLKNLLEERGQRVLFPVLPNFENPQLNEWLSFLEDELKDVDPNSLVVAAHSLGCSIWLKYLNKHPGTHPKKTFLVSPPLNDCGVQEIESFFPTPKLDLSNENCLIIGSDNDHFIPKNEFETMAENLKVPFKLLPGAGHINSPMHGDWEWMNQQCLKYC